MLRYADVSIYRRLFFFSNSAIIGRVDKRFPNDTTQNNRHGISWAFLMTFFIKYYVCKTQTEYIEEERGTEI